MDIKFTVSPLHAGWLCIILLSLNEGEPAGAFLSRRWRGVLLTSRWLVRRVVLQAKGLLRRNKSVSLFRPLLRKLQTSAVLHDGA